MRRANDAYYTPGWATDRLLEHVPLQNRRILECCAGDGAISRRLEHAGSSVIMNDIEGVDMNSHFDVTDPYGWKALWDKYGEFQWIVTNPPFKHAFEILLHSHKRATIGVAFLLRLSFLEPTFDRGEWLQENPPTGVLVLPRISFTGDGKTDSVTCAWMVWNKTDSDLWVKIASKGRRRG